MPVWKQLLSRHDIPIRQKAGIFRLNRNAGVAQIVALKKTGVRDLRLHQEYIRARFRSGIAD